METFILFESVWTVLVALLFAGIVIWAWSGKRKKTFDEAARLPFDQDDPDLSPSNNTQEKAHG
ncbi:MAG: cbb3-type cytochrome c oxidase subunit 3 [Gammaproteobacteria bacterium]|nr:cbb3-type cytochrome c oxidase subunit 3 [Gammaproteobacteria bacterium]